LIIFARTRHVYDSYTDFWRLVELGNFPICYIDEVNLGQRNVYITTMIDPNPDGEWAQMIKLQEGQRRNAHLILWNLERPKGWCQTVMRYNERCHLMLSRRWFDEIWVSDRRLAQESELRHVILGSHPGLGTPGALDEKSYGLVHMSYATNRRQTVYKHFDSIGPSCWGEERDRVLRASRFALNVHQDDHPFQEPLRFALFAAYGLPILSEAMFDAYPWGTENMVFDNFPHLAGHLRAMLENRYERWARFGLRGRELLCDRYEFGKTVREAVFKTTGETG